MSLRGRVGVVTGAGRGMGADIARALAAEGMSLALIARTGPEVRELADALTEEHGVRCFPAAVDVTDAAAIDRVVMHVEQHLGPVDLLVNNEPESDRLTQALLPTMVQRGRGHVVNVSGVPVDVQSQLVAAIARSAHVDHAGTVLEAVDLPKS